MLQSDTQLKGIVAEPVSVVPVADVEFILPNASILFSKVDAGPVYTRAEITAIVLNPDSQNQHLVEILTVNQLISIGSNKTFADVLGFQDDNTPDAINYIDTALGKSDVAPATDVLSRTVFFNRNFDDVASSVDGVVSVRPGITFNGDAFNGSTLGWEFFGSREILFTDIGKNLLEPMTYSEALDYAVTKSLNDSPTLNDSISITLDKDSTITLEATATDDAQVALQTFFVMNGAVLNNRPIN